MYLRMLCKHTTKMMNLFAVYSRIICVNTTTITIASSFNDQVYENVIAHNICFSVILRVQLNCNYYPDMIM